MKMNKIAICMIIATMIFVSCTKEEIMPGDNLPTEIKTFITTHYPSQLIRESETDITDSLKTYDIQLNNSTSLEFNYKKEIVGY
jgi:hypothetical protein